MTTAKTQKMKSRDEGTPVPFTVASHADFRKVTVRLQPLASAGRNLSILSLSKGSEFIVSLFDKRSQSPIRVIFTVNREHLTAVTNMWPHRFLMPRVGYPVKENVLSISTSL